ncbi:MAG: GFA family protein [Bdellovibrionota bacterium]
MHEHRQTKTNQGSCLCKKVKATATHVPHKIGVCHCGMCRKWAGGPFFCVNVGTDVVFKGTENIALYDSSEWAERGFCKSCGTHIFYRLKSNQHHFMAVGFFDSEQPFQFDHQIFIDKKPSYYEFLNQTSTMTEEEVFAMFAPSS